MKMREMKCLVDNGRYRKHKENMVKYKEPLDIIYARFKHGREK